MKGITRALVVVLALIIPLAATADDVTISGTVTFASIDGSSLDHDGAANGVFTVDDGDLTILGTVQCNDVSSPNACPMAFTASGSITLAPGSALYAENRSGAGSGGNITLTAGTDVVVSGSSSTQPGAIISSGNEHSAASAGGHIAIDAGGSASFGAGSVVSSAAKGGFAGSINVTADGAISAAGLIAAGPSSILAATRYTGAVLTGGSASHTGGAITLLSTSHAEPALTVASTATIVSQGGSGNAGHVVLEGCGININGLVASVSTSGSSAKVTVRSGTSVNIDGRDLGGSGTRAAKLRADSIQESAAGYSVNVFAREAVSVLGPASGTHYVLNSNGGSTSNDASGTVTVMSTGASVAASGNVASAANGDAGDQGGSIQIAAAFDAILDTANLVASGNHSTNNPNRAGGSINVRAHSGAVSWQNGSGDVRPTGSSSGVAAAKQGTITLTYCTSVSTSGSTFPTNGAATGTFPATVQSCSPVAPSLPAGETHPDCNDPALAVDDAYTVAEGGTLNVAAPGVLANDSDPDGDPLTAVLVSGPANASSFTLNADGSFTYVHDGGETTSDSFTYVANDGATNSNTATVQITITPVNDAPVANDDSYDVDEAGTINYAAPGVLANDTDSDGPAMSAILLTGPSNASSFTLNADGSFIYVHDGSETTSDSFTYKANDGFLDSSVATVSITINPVNDAPVANDDSASVAEGGTINQAAPGVLGNDTDAEGSSLTAVLVSGPANASSFTLNADGSYTYVHDGGESTSDSFTYKANDGSADSNVATVTITISAVNDAPVAVGDAYSVDEGDTLVVGAPGVLGNDTDPDSSITAVLVTGPANASSFTLNADGSFSYTHDGSETTSDSFTYKANDGSLDSNTVTVSITINPVNDAPVANDDSGSVAEGGTLNGASVLGNDTDAENDPLTAVLVTGPANASSFTLNADGTYTYVHDGGETTSDSFTYKANDGAADSNVATVTITISAVNDAPVATGESYTVAEGGTLNVAAPGVLGNDTDAENDALTAVLVSGPANASSFTLNADGSFTYVHDGSETTSDSFTYKANDGSADSNVVTVSITITPVNDAPVAVGEAYSVDEGDTLVVGAPGVLGNDTDAENDSLTAVLVSGPANASSFTLNADGSFTYAHNGSETTSDSFTYKANDGSADSNTVTVTITVNPINDAPVAVGDAYSVSEGGTLNVAAPGVLGNDTDPDSTISAVLVSGPANASSFTLNADGSFTYVHDGGESTTDSFTYKASDGSADSNVVTVSITITPVNDAPVAVGEAYSVDEGDTLVIGAPGVLGNDTDAENDALSAILVSGPANASSFALNADGSFTYVHDGSETTSDSFTYKANDGSADSNTVTVTITVNPVNDAPVAVADSYSVNFGGTLNVSAPGVLGNDSDAEGSSLTAVLVSGTSNGMLTFNADGSFSYTHTGSTLGTDSFTYKANDGAADSNIVTVTINIVNQPPVASDDSFLSVGNTELRVGTGTALHPAAVVSGSVLANDTDADGGPSPLVVSAFDATSANGGSVSMNPNGSFNYLPPTGFVGTDTFNYTITDSQATDSGTVAILMTDRVWYVNPLAAGPQSGRSTDPFATIGQAQGISSVNDYIHVAQGAQATGITLKNGQRLVGSGVALVVPPYTLTGATARPTLGGTVRLADANLVTGLNVAGISTGILGISVNGGIITEVGVTAGGDGISLTTSTGVFSIGDVTLTPGGRGLFISGGSATVTAANLDITTTNSPAIFADAGTLNIGPGSDGSTVSTTNGIGINISGMTLGIVLRSVNVNAGAVAANGIKLVGTTGSFSVTGAGAAGTGGTIQNNITRGADLQHNGSIALAFMNFTNANSVNGDAPSVCGNTLAGTNTGCNAAIHVVGATGLALTGVNVTGGAQIGINGNNVSNLTMHNVSVTGAGNELFEHGVQFVNLSGTGAVTNSTFSGNFHRQFTVQNSSGTLSLNVAGSTFNGTGVANPSGAQGVLISGNGTASITTNVQSSLFTNNFSTGYFSDGANSAALDVTVSGNTFTANGGGGVTLGTTNAATLAYDILNNAISGGVSAPIAVLKGAGSTGSVSGTIAGNTLGLAGVPASACSAGACDGILLNGNGSGSFTVAVDNNTIRNFTSRGIALNASETVQANAAIRNNIVSEPGPSSSSGVFAQSGVLSADTSSLCADIQGNAISGAYAGGQIRVRNRFAGTTFRLPGYAGAGNDTTAVAAFLSGQNGGATATATINANTFGGGAACVAP